MVFEAGEIGGNVNLSASNGGRFFSVSKIPSFGWLKIGGMRCANRAVMFC